MKESQKKNVELKSFKVVEVLRKKKEKKKRGKEQNTDIGRLMNADVFNQRVELNLAKCR